MAKKFHKFHPTGDPASPQYRQKMHFSRKKKRGKEKQRIFAVVYADPEYLEEKGFLPVKVRYPPHHSDFLGVSGHPLDCKCDLCQGKYQ